MEKIVDVERLNRHLSEFAWAPTVEISRTELLALLSRLEEAEQAVDDLRGRYDEAETARIDGDAQLDRVRELHSYGKLIYPNGDEEHYCTYDENAWPCETIRALDGEQA